MSVWNNLFEACMSLPKNDVWRVALSLALSAPLPVVVNVALKFVCDG